MVADRPVMNQLRDEAGMRHQRWPDHYNDYDRLLRVASEHGLGLQMVEHTELENLERFDRTLRGVWRSSYESRVCWEPGPYVGWRLHKVIDRRDGAAVLSGDSRPTHADLAGGAFGQIFAVRYDIDGSVRHAHYLDHVVMRTSVPMRDLVRELHESMLSSGEVMSLETAEDVARVIRVRETGTFFTPECVELALEAAKHMMITDYVLNAFEGETELKESIKQAQGFEAMRNNTPQ